MSALSNQLPMLSASATEPEKKESKQIETVPSHTTKKEPSSKKEGGKKESNKKAKNKKAKASEPSSAKPAHPPLIDNAGKELKKDSRPERNLHSDISALQELIDECNFRTGQTHSLRSQLQFAEQSATLTVMLEAYRDIEKLHPPGLHRLELVNKYDADHPWTLTGPFYNTVNKRICVRNPNMFYLSEY